MEVASDQYQETPWSHAFPGTHLMLELWRHTDLRLLILPQRVGKVGTPVGVALPLNSGRS
jgi:hypothetical protein